jgi:uroporphyrinogen III methyltransferase/synthase
MKNNLTPHPLLHQERGRTEEAIYRGLSGKTVVITRAEAQSSELSQLLRLRGATPILYPCVAIVPLADTQALDEGLQAAARGEYDWLIITSVNVTRLLQARCAELNISLGRQRVAVVGAKTTQFVQATGWQVAHQARHAEALAATLPDPHNSRILLPQSDAAPETLSTVLAARGATVTRLTLYQTCIGTGGAPLAALLQQNTIDAVTLCSPSAARYLIHRLMNEQGILATLNRVAIACIGHTTAEAAYQQGLYVTAIGDNTLAGMVNALEQTYT